MEVENPYLKVIEDNQAEKAAILEPIKSQIPKEELANLRLLGTKTVKERGVKKQDKNRECSPYQMRTRKRAVGDGSFHPFRRISPRTARMDRRSLKEEESLGNLTMPLSLQREMQPRMPEGTLRLEDHVQYVEKESWKQHLSRVGLFPPCAVAGKEEAGVVGGRWLDGRWLEGALQKAKEGQRAWEYPKKGTENLDRFKERVSQLSMWCGCMARLLLERVSSLAVHPSKDKLVIAAGGMKGSIGLWIVNPALSSEGGLLKSEEPNETATGIYRFKPHSGLINCTSFCNFNADRLFTSSYDGTVRSLNFERLVFDEMLSMPIELSKNWVQWHCQLSANILLVSQGMGNVYVLDDRTKSQHEAILNCHERSCRTVCVHPLHPMYMATCSSLGEVCIWDLRKFGRKGQRAGVQSSGAIGHMHIHGTVSSAFFSPNTGNGLLVTSSDDHLRIYDTSKLVEGKQSPTVFRVETDIRHHHKSGMWLTPFRATWHPQRDDAFVVGSLANPRQVEVYGKHGRMLCALGNRGHFPINTVCPVNAFHPNRMLLASADSGGRVHILL